ncbi:TlpA family protein disulfide reductase [Halobacteriales archaeon SW_7_71_33]|nr:MAG: TlpA family protein disulfide reductase [Halobacteriales archaeon SW_7_71_33]
MNRRRLLAGVGAAAVGGLAGCLGAVTDDSDGGDGDRSDYDGLTVDTLSVAGSPGDAVPVAPERVTLLDFFATWCAPCKPQMAELRAVDRQFSDVHLLSITSERDEDAVRSFWREYEGTWPVGVDPDLDVSSEYRAGSVPTMVVLDPAGEQRWRHSGLAAADSIAAELEAAGAARDA